MNPTTTPQNRAATRSSLACLPCRSRHLKCDGKRPQCSRCVEFEKPCDYAPSRRGGLDRAALAERRKRLAAADNASNDVSAPRLPDSQSQGPGESPTQRVDVDLTHGSLLDGFSVEDEDSGSSSPAAPQLHVDDIEKDTLIASYYRNFHKLHPFVLPKKHLVRVYQDPEKQLSFTPLIAVMRLVGHIYAAKELSIRLKEHAEACILQLVLTGPVVVQCRLLYSIALFWHSYKSEAKREMNIATKLAIELQMFRQEFANHHGGGNPVLTECWRRTWWMLYIVDAYYAGTLGTMNFATVDIDATVELPCEESEFESGEIPEPQTLDHFDSREFAPDGTAFSSFAYLISAVRCAALAISTAPKIAAKEDSTHLIQSADSVIEAWTLLLPKERRQVMLKTGEIDELMFQAHLLIHVATIGLHRPLSDLKFNPLEDVSSCAREPPLDNPTPDLVNVHMVRVLRAVEGQIRLLALPVRPFHHTPFATCMVSEGTLALLSACNFLLKGKGLAIARDQIRMTIGCLQVLGEVWPRTARNVKEIQTIARKVLGLRKRDATSSSTPASSRVPSLSDGDGQASRGSEPEVPGTETDVFASLGSMEDVCGWYNLSDLGPELTHWMDTDSL